MQIKYRGYLIDVHREDCLAGYPLLYYYVMRLDDGWFAVDSFEDSDETVRDMIRNMKERINAELAEEDPWMEKEEKDLLRFA